MREYEADILSAADGDDRPDGKCVHEMYLKYEVDARIAALESALRRMPCTSDSCAWTCEVCRIKKEVGITD